MPKGYYHLTRDLRRQIYALKASGLSQRRISAAIAVAPSTISRELKRNTGQRGYRINQADTRANERRQAASQQPKKLTDTLKSLIEQRLSEGWSPEQIAGRCKRESISISHETIYRYIWQNKRTGGLLYQHLRRCGKRYNKRGASKAGRGCIPQPHRVDIAERPAIVAEKSRIGDWEGDTIIGAKHQQAIVSYVERHSKFTLLAKIVAKTADNVYQATVKRMQALPHPIHTITYDNGKEFAAHQRIARTLNTQCYFATPYHSWERGLNEHTNGLVRQYIPKSTDLSQITNEQISAIENRLNHRPRKVLQYRTPFEVFFADTLSKQSVALQC